MRSKTNSKIEKMVKNTFQTSMKNKSEEEYYNFSDSSLELFDSFKPRPQKKKIAPKINSGEVVDQIDLTNMYVESKLIEKKYSLSTITIDSDSSSDELDSFKSARSVVSPVLSSLNDTNKNNQDLCDSFPKKVNKKSICKSLHNNDNFTLNTVQNHFSEHKYINISNNCFTPENKNLKIVSESAKLLDRMYGKEWRNIDGVIKNVKIKINDENFENDNK